MTLPLAAGQEDAKSARVAPFPPTRLFDRNRRLSAAPLPPVTQPGEAIAAYAAHRETQQKQNARRAALAVGMSLFGKISADPPESESRLDARIAVFLRVEGYSREAVIQAIRQGASESRSDEKRDWRRYAARTAAYAFGVAGDMELVRLGWVVPQKNETLPPEHPKSEPQQGAPRLRMR